MFDENEGAQETSASGILVLSVGCGLMLVLTIAALLLGFVVFMALAPAADTTTTGSQPTPEATPIVALPSVLETGEFPDAAPYTWETVADGFDSPLYVTGAGDGSGRLFVVEQGGFIWILENDVILPEPFLDISDLIPASVSRGGYTEQGLLGLAFHPDFENNGTFFINYTDTSGATTLARYRTMPNDRNRANPATVAILLVVAQPAPDHNGGHIAFGPDGYLYIALGDGGSLYDPNRTSQNRGVLLGKLLRLDVTDITAAAYSIPPDNPFVGQEGMLPEIWVFGVRNPWRFSFDRATDELYIADVGQVEREELNVQPADSPGGENYGWSAWEGTFRVYPDREPATEELVFPVFEYPHSEGCSITGGYVYRGATLPELQGTYISGDYCTGRVWMVFRNAAGEWQSGLWMQTTAIITSFGEDEAGELYLVDYKGIILRLARTQ